MTDTTRKLVTGHVLSPLAYSGSVFGDYGYEIEGVKSERSYVSAYSARRALRRELIKINEAYWASVTNN